MRERKIPVWVGRQRDGRHMITEICPIREFVGCTGKRDLYVVPGDGLGYRHLCEESVLLLFGLRLKPLECRRVWIMGGVLRPVGLPLDRMSLVDPEAVGI